MTGAHAGTRALPALPSSTSSCSSRLPVRPCLSLNDLWLSMASVHRPKRESLLSLWLISQGKTTHGWTSSIKPVCGGPKRGKQCLQGLWVRVVITGN